MTIVCNSPPVFYFLARSCVCDSIYNTTFLFFFLYFLFFVLFNFGDRTKQKIFVRILGDLSRSKTRSRLVQSLYNLLPTLLPSISVQCFRLIYKRNRTNMNKKKITNDKTERRFSFFFSNLFYFVFLDSKNKHAVSLNLTFFFSSVKYYYYYY